MKLKDCSVNLKKFSFAAMVVVSLASASSVIANVTHHTEESPTFSSVTDFIGYVKDNGYSAFLKPFHIEGTNPFDIANEKVSIFWNTKQQTATANKIFRDWFEFKSLSEGYDATANYFQGQTTLIKGNYTNNSIIVINKDVAGIKDELLEPMKLFPQLSKAYPEFFPTKQELTKSLQSLSENYAHYLLLHELAHGSNYQDMIYLDAQDIPKDLYEFASEMHSDLTAIMTIISSEGFDQNKAVSLIDGMIAKRAMALIYSDDEITFSFDTAHASMSGLIILRNHITDDSELLSGLSHFSINSMAGDITQASVVPSEVRRFDLIEEATVIDSLDDYVKILTTFKNQANEISEHAFGIKSTVKPITSQLTI